MGIREIYEANGLFFSIVFTSLSLASLTVVIWKLWLNHNAKTDLPDFLGRLDQTLATHGVNGAIQMCDAEPGVVPKVFVTTLQTYPQGKVATRNAISSLIELDLLPDLRFLLPLMSTIFKLAPMLGLLGTVWGMIMAFGKIAGATKVNPSDLSRDIGMALFTTAEGLLIAIPMIFCYSMFVARVNKFEVELQRAAAAALDLIPRLPKRAPGPTPGPMPGGMPGPGPAPGPSPGPAPMRV